MIFEYYIIAALSFALMYAYSYGWEISKTVLDVLYMFDIDYRKEPQALWGPYLYTFWSFVVALVIFPAALFVILFEPKYETIKTASGNILQDSFGFEKQEEDEK